MRPESPIDMPALRVRELDPRTDRRWQEFVAGHPEGLIYHHPAWLQVLEHEYGDNLIALACEDGAGNIHGLLPLCRTRGVPLRLGGALAGRRLSSLPRTPIGGPLASSAEAAAALVDAAVELVRGDSGLRLELKPPAPIEGVDSVPWSMSYVLELPVDAAGIRFGSARNHGRIKWAVSKASRAGVRVRVAETEGDLRSWYRLYLEAMRAHAVPPRPRSFFLTAWRALHPRGMLRLLLAERPEGSRLTLLAGSIFLMFGQTVVFAFNGRSSRELAFRPNDAIHWQAIHDACRDGFQRYDLGEVERDQSGLDQFKRKWGAEPRLLHRYYFPPLDRRSPIDVPPSRRARLRKAVWQRLPLDATEALGTHLYRYL